MRVENENDRMDDPGECDNCSVEAELERFSYFGPGHQVEWLCCYCTEDFTRGKSDIVKSVAAMLHTLEKKISLIGVQN